jgi:RecB family exonuclease
MSPRPASAQIRTLLDFWLAHVRPLEDGDTFTDRERRARAAILELLATLAAVHEAQDDPVWTVDDLGLAVRRGIEEQTFAAQSAGAGVHLVDDQAVRYGDFDEVTILGMIEPDWPDRPRRNIFYPPALLKSLGWPTEKDRRAADDARFLDLLASASKRTVISTFTLDDDALVSRSVQLDEIPRARLSSAVRSANDGTRVFVDEALSIDPPAFDALLPAVREWAEMRIGRTPGTAAEFHGAVGPSPPRVWSVSALETYLDCPFKFFAQRVLKLEEEPEDEEVMDPRRQGQFVHEVFEAFFAAWQQAGHHAVTRANLPEAADMFTAVVDEALERLPAAEAGLERTRLLGSSAAAGLGDAVLRMEAERPVAVVERLLEHELTGEFTLAAADGPRSVALRGKADRLDLLEDGTFRLIDYKLGWPPNRARALQLPIYGLCAEQRLTSSRGRQWVLGEAVYLAFKGPRRVVPLFTSAGDRAKVLADAQQRLVDTVAAIAAGDFPPRPDDVFRCETCSFAAVCRKDYVGDV